MNYGVTNSIEKISSKQVFLNEVYSMMVLNDFQYIFFVSGKNERILLLSEERKKNKKCEEKRRKKIKNEEKNTNKRKTK